MCHVCILWDVCMFRLRLLPAYSHKVIVIAQQNREKALYTDEDNKENNKNN